MIIIIFVATTTKHIAIRPTTERKLTTTHDGGSSLPYKMAQARGSRLSLAASS